MKCKMKNNMLLVSVKPVHGLKVHTAFTHDHLKQLGMHVGVLCTLIFIFFICSNVITYVTDLEGKVKHLQIRAPGSALYNDNYVLLPSHVACAVFRLYIAYTTLLM